MSMLSERMLDRLDRAVVSGRIVPYLVGVTLAVTLASALVVRVFAHDEFTSYGESAWWAAQTVTTVGYGDVIPQTGFAKAVAVIVMLVGIALVSLLTAVVTSAVVARTQLRLAARERAERAEAAAGNDDPHLAALERIERRLAELERRLAG